MVSSTLNNSKSISDRSIWNFSYTERYMGSIEKNAQAYKDSCIIGKIGRLPDEEGRLLIVHGLQDENVHFAHTEKLINALISAGKPFQQLVCLLILAIGWKFRYFRVNDMELGMLKLLNFSMPVWFHFSIRHYVEQATIVYR